ncbi:hypothetical protein FOL47_001200 [Perkinsus chesapeaki]|uniref:Reverse transcriptase domain-containing protein n=1 Tax=Perkinsus chesapeaki TaxID=330153 RepID=A0A7J6KUZ7_PERCH|nr:hypothetical protein FOL47_001200 [Perkinsus chesapeaki]
MPPIPPPSRQLRSQNRSAAKSSDRAASGSQSANSSSANTPHPAGRGIDWAEITDLDEQLESSRTPMDWAETITNVVNGVLAQEGKYFSLAKADIILKAIESMKTGYIRILEQNISLKDKLLSKASETPPVVSYRGALLSGIPHTSRLPPPSKTIVVKPTSLPDDPIGRKSTILNLQKTLGATVRDKAIVVDTITTRRGDVAIKVPENTDTDEIISTINSAIPSGKAAVANKLQPEVMISLAGTSDITPDKILSDVPLYMPGTDTQNWKIIRANSKMVTVRMPCRDRDRIMKEGFIVVDTLRLRCRDVIGIRACFSCGSCHGQAAPCREKKSCLTCGGQHEMRDCPNRELPLDQRRCSLCGGSGHNYHEGPLCRVKLRGDTNGYSHVWGIYPPNLSSRNEVAYRYGREMESLVLSTGLTCYNNTDDIQPTYHHAASTATERRSTIDATFGTNDMLVTNWRVATDLSPYGSDHYPILFSLSSQVTMNEPHHQHELSNFCHSKICWTTFTNHINSCEAAFLEREAFDPSDHIDVLERRISGVIQQAARASCPSRDPNATPRPVNSWWDNDLKDARASLARTRRLHGHTSANYREERLKYRRLIDEKKSSSFVRFASTIEDDPNFLNKVTREPVLPPTTIIGYPTVEGTVSALADKYLGSTSYDPAIVVSSSVEAGSISPHDNLLADSHPDFAVSLVKAEILSKQKSTTPGSCGIRWDHLVYCPDWLVRELCRLFQLSLSKGFVPTHWRSSTVIYIPKPSGYGTIKGVRPITLSCTLCKLMEAMIILRLSAAIDQVLASREQYAYLPGRSSVSLVKDLLHHVQVGFTGKIVKKKPPWAIAGLDLSNAFGSIPHDKLITAIAALGVPSTEQHWIQSWLAPRRNTNRYLGISSSRLADSNVGLSQGSVLSPILFVLFMHYWLNHITAQLGPKKFGLRWFVYADDCYIAFKFRLRTSSGIMDQEINNFLTALTTALDTVNLKLSMEKTAVLTGYNSTCFRSKFMSILGMTISSKLSFSQHLKAKLAKCHNLTMKILRFTRKSYGISPTGVLQLARSVWLPTISYGLEVWGVSLVHKSTCGLIDSAYRSIIRMAYRLPQSTPINFIDIMHGGPCLSDILIDKLLVKILHKMESPSSGDLLPAHFGWNRSLRTKWRHVLSTRLPQMATTDRYTKGTRPPPDIRRRILVGSHPEAGTNYWRCLAGLHFGRCWICGGRL